MCENRKVEALMASFAMRNDSPIDKELKELMDIHVNGSYSARSTNEKYDAIMGRCKELFERNYVVSEIPNPRGKLSEHYPKSILILENNNYGSQVNDLPAKSLEEIIRHGNTSRARTRFPVPVILYDGKNICRSATLSGCAEILTRKGKSMLSSSSGVREFVDLNLRQILVDRRPECSTEWKVFERTRTADILLLQSMKVEKIFDLMVENRKHKCGIPITSSEKVENEDMRYKSLFTLISIPYPGCEFFRQYHANNFVGENLVYDWNRPMCDAELNVETPPVSDINVNWSEYKTWDLIKITENYFKYILKSFKDGNSGILIHCVSGWDRTPLFITLIRLSLWADGLIHTNLNEHEILYLTIAYDWMMFGHRLDVRIQYKEDIMLFCYQFLKYITSDEYSLCPKVPKNLETIFEEAKTNNSEEEKTKNVLEVPTMDEDSSSPLMFPFSPLVSPSQSYEQSSLDGQEDDAPMPDATESIPSFFNLPSTSKRSESELSDSWLFLSGTGSVKGQSCVGSDSDISRCSNNSSPCPTSNNREARLLAVRTLFHQYYFPAASHCLDYITNQSVLQALYNQVMGIIPDLN